VSEPHGRDASSGQNVPPQATAPGARPVQTPAGRATGARFALVALAVAALALLLAFGSALFAWRAVDQAKDAKSIALSRPAPDAPSPVAATTAPEPGQLPSDLPSVPEDVPRSPGSAPELTEQTVYEPKYEKQPLVLKSSCSYSMYADLDEPRAKNDAADGDVKFTTGCGNDPSAFRLLDGVLGSEAARPGMTPKECAERIRTAPVGQNAPIPVRKGTAVCVTTNYGEARAHGDKWRMILMYVVGVANDGAATVEVTAWNIPD
jgi:hypothetical protein